MEILAKAGLVVMVLAVIFADKLPTAKKQDGKVLLYFIGFVLIIGFIACQGGDAV